MQIIVFLAILTVVVLVHELGHFAAARFFGIKVEEFGFGFPPKVMKLFKRGETEYTLNWLPIGGFVRIYGENGEGQGVKDARAFWSKPVWQRAIVLVAGVVMNFVLGVVLFGIVYSVLGVPADIDGARILHVVENSPAAEAGLEEGVLIKAIEIDGETTEVGGSDEFVTKVAENLGVEIGLLTEADGETSSVNLTPRRDPPEGEGSLGVVITDTELRQYPWYEMPVRGMWVGLQEAVAWGGEIVGVVGRLATGRGFREVSGVVGIYQISGQAVDAGFLAVLQFVGILSINLMILNLLPLPGLDGGRLVFLGIEFLRGGKKLREDVEGWINMVGMVLILGLMVVITFNDVIRLLGGWTMIRERVESLL